MKSLERLGLLLVATCALAAVTASAAQATLPELGRCVAVEKTAEEGQKPRYHGVWSNKKCTKVNTNHAGKYEWLPGPGPEGKTVKSTWNEEPMLETTGGVTVECSFGGGEEVEYTGPKTMKIGSLHLANCRSGVPSQYCQTSPAAKGEIVSAGAIEAQLGLVGGARPTAGWDLKHEGPGPIFAFVCGTTPEEETVETIEGSVIGALQRGALGDVNRMNKNALLFFKQEAGKQMPEAFEGGEKDTLTTTRVKLVSHMVEPTGFLALDFGSTVEPLEVKTVGEPPA